RSAALVHGEQVVAAGRGDLAGRVQVLVLLRTRDFELRPRADQGRRIDALPAVGPRREVGVGDDLVLVRAARGAAVDRARDHLGAVAPRIVGLGPEAQFVVAPRQRRRERTALGAVLA